MSFIIHAPRDFRVKDDNQIMLLIIDPQVRSCYLIYIYYSLHTYYTRVYIQIDFHEGGSLAVPGANADALRIKNMIMSD